MTLGLIAAAVALLLGECAQMDRPCGVDVEYVLDDGSVWCREPSGGLFYPAEWNDR